MEVNNNIAVSIIVPVYNCEDKKLAKCLITLITQTLRNIEIICVNDGSTDKSLEILERYAAKDSRIIVVSQENSGPGLARQKGVNLARGEYIGFVDADDNVSSKYFEVLYNTAKAYPQSEVVFLEYTHNEDVVYKKEKLHNEFELVTTKEKSELFMGLPIWTKLYKRDFVLKYGQFCKKAHFIEDALFWETMLLNLKSVIYLIDSEIRYNYIKWENGALSSIKTNKTSFIYLETFDKIKDLINNLEISNEDKEIYLKCLNEQWLMVSEDVYQNLEHKYKLEYKNIITEKYPFLIPSLIES